MCVKPMLLFQTPTTHIELSWLEACFAGIVLDVCLYGFGFVDGGRAAPRAKPDEATKGVDMAALSKTERDTPTFSLDNQACPQFRLDLDR
jgi:hypothetical protein